MPGLNQLKKFSEDVLNLGDEIKLRADRGEKPVSVPIPQDIDTRDDSEDFILGMPRKRDENQPPDEQTQSDAELQNEASQSVSPNEDSSADLDTLLDSLQNTAVEPEEADLNDFLDSVSDDSAGTAVTPESPEETPQEPENSDLQNSEDSDNFDDFAFDGESIDLSSDLPEEIAETDAGPSGHQIEPAALSESDEKQANEDFNLDSIPEGLFDIDDLDETPLTENDKGESTESPAEISENSAEPAPETDTSEIQEVSAVPVTDRADDVSGESLNDIDTSAMDDIDFDFPVHDDSSDKTASVDLPDFDIPDTDEKIAGDDFELEGTAPGEISEFEIPGFSDTTSAELENLPTPDYSNAQKTAAPHRNELSDADYEKFKKNLLLYPLNVRIAVEDLIVKNEFTDDAVFEIIRNIIKRLPARQVAAQLEKMLDISLNVPRDYERRTASEYASYKASLQYQLRNRIIPGTLLGICAVIIGLGLFMFSKRFVYRPLMAGKLYKQGYELLQADEYPQADGKFNEAVSYDLQKKWFFKYAAGYREHKQYNRAEDMYKNILNVFDYDKQAGLDYADMERRNLANYAMAEQILKRDVLDHYINDKQALLQLGDTYMDWGESEDPSKLEDARVQYSRLIQLYGSTNLYLSRMMRYFIQTDNLREVLKLKNIFFPNKKSLGAQDWTSLSGYLLDKLYAPLSSSDEYLRNYIEDVREMLQRAIDADPANPTAHYNFARYFVNRKNSRLAQLSLEETLKLYDTIKTRTPKDLFRQIDTYRMLGELYNNDSEYIKATETYTKGIDLFELEQKNSGLSSGDKNTGKLYADMADIDYFVSGDMDNALRNYEKSIANNNDTPEIRYHIGFIQYGSDNYLGAWGSFVKAAGDRLSDNNLLLALGNVLSLRNDDFAAKGYYENLLSNLDTERARKGILLPQVTPEDGNLVDLYMKAANNLGVTLYRLAAQTGNSSLNAEAIVRFSESMRAWDALTRNQSTMVRLPGSNLAQRNSSYASHPQPDYSPAIYTVIPRTLTYENGMKQ